MKLWEQSLGVVRDSGERRYYIVLYQQPLHRVVVTTLYGWWTDLTWPVYSKLEKMPVFRDRDIPLTNAQDLRYEYLRDKDRWLVHRFEITRDLFHSLTEKG